MNYWSLELPHPLSPSNEDASVYKDHLLIGSTLLLGCTHKLISISDWQLDIDPWYVANTVIKGDWRNNTKKYTNIMGDGVLNFTQELTDGVLNMASKHCSRLIVRSFNYKLNTMRIANYFPSSCDFKLKPSIAIILKEYSFYVWDM